MNADGKMRTVSDDTILATHKEETSTLASQVLDYLYDNSIEADTEIQCNNSNSETKNAMESLETTDLFVKNDEKVKVDSNELQIQTTQEPQSLEKTQKPPKPPIPPTPSKLPPKPKNIENKLNQPVVKEDVKEVRVVPRPKSAELKRPIKPKLSTDNPKQDKLDKERDFSKSKSPPKNPGHLLSKKKKN